MSCSLKTMFPEVPRTLLQQMRDRYLKQHAPHLEHLFWTRPPDLLSPPLTARYNGGQEAAILWSGEPRISPPNSTSFYAEIRRPAQLQRESMKVGGTRWKELLTMPVNPSGGLYDIRSERHLVSLLWCPVVSVYSVWFVC